MPFVQTARRFFGVHFLGVHSMTAAILAAGCVGALLPASTTTTVTTTPVARAAYSTALGAGPVLVVGGSENEPVEEDLISLGDTQQAADLLNAVRPYLTPAHQAESDGTLLKYAIVGCVVMNDQPLYAPEDIVTALSNAYGFDRDEVVSLLTLAQSSMCPQDDNIVALMQGG